MPMPKHVDDEAVLGSGELVETLLHEEEPDTWGAAATDSEES